jgi:hypothetical protein
MENCKAWREVKSMVTRREKHDLMDLGEGKGTFRLGGTRKGTGECVNMLIVKKRPYPSQVLTGIRLLGWKNRKTINRIE